MIRPLDPRQARRKARLPDHARLELQPLEDRCLLANASGVVAGLAFIDHNGNGSYDAQEVRLPGVNVTLSGRSNQGTPVLVTTGTDAGGAYRFLNVQPGVYSVSAAPVTGLTGQSVTFGSFAVGGGQTVQQHVRFRGIDPQFISMNMFLSSYPGHAFLSVPAGSGVAFASARANNAPFVKADADRNIAAGKNFPDQLIDLSTVFDDPDLATNADELLTYAVLSNSNGSLLTATIEGSNLRLAFAANATGNAVVGVRATDRFGASVSTTFTVTVTNGAPTAGVSLSPTAPGTNDTLTATVNAFDPNGDPVTLTYVWKVDGVVKKTTASTSARTDTFDLSQAGNGDRGQVITVEVTPSDGTLNGAVASASATVADSVPVIGSVTLTPTNPGTDDTVTATVGGVTDADGDPVTLTYVWKIDGGVVKTTAATASLTDTLDLGQAGNGNRGQVVSVEVTPSDGTLSGAAVTASTMVANAAPVAGTIADQTFSGPGLFALDVSGSFSDPDGDALTFSAALADGSPLPGWLQVSTAGLLAGNPSVRDEGTLMVRVTATDTFGLSASTTFQLLLSNTPVSLNDLPTASVSLNTASPSTNDALTATVTASDPDGDALTFTYVWKVNGTVVKTTAATASLSDTLDLGAAGNGDRGDLVTVEVTPFDGTASGAITTANATVANSAPTVSVALDSSAPLTNDTLTATATASDSDGDAVTLTYVWKVDGVVVKTTAATASLTDTLDLSIAGNGDRGQVVTVEVTPFDGTDSGSAATASATVASSAPVAGTIADQTFSGPGLFTLDITGSFSDPDGDALGFTAALADDSPLPAWLHLTAAGVLSGNPSVNDEGTLTIRVTATDPEALSASTAFQLTLSNTPDSLNDLPTANVSLNTGSPATNDTLTATVTASDADGDPLTFTYVWKVNGTVVQTTAGTAALTDTLDLSQAGNGDRGDLVIVEVTPFDGTANGAIATANATVANSAPTATVSLNTPAPLTNDTVTASVTAADADGDAVTLTYVWKVDGVVVQTTAATTSLTDTLDLSVAGNGDRGQVITVEVTPFDGTDGGTAASASATVASSAPVAGTIADQTFSGPGVFSLDVSGGFSDPDGDPLTFSATLGDGSPLPGWLHLSAAGLFSGNPSVNDAGTLTIRVTATDPFTLSAAATFQLTLSNTPDSLNDDPTASVSLDLSAPTTNDTLTATVTASDPDGDALTFTYVWKVNGAVVRTTAATTSLTDTLDLSQAGNGDRGDLVTVEVTPFDGTGFGAITIASATVANTAPTATVGLDSSAPLTDDTLTATATSSDADGDAVTFTYVWKVDGVVVKTTAGTTSLTDTLDLSVAGNGDRGQVITVEVTPSDGTDSGSAATASVTVASTAPVAGTIADQTFSGAGVFTLDVAGNFSDADDDPLTFSATLGDGSPLPGWLHLSAAGLFSGNPSVNDEGILVIRVTATDPDSLSAATTFQLTLSNTPDSLNDEPAVTVALDSLVPSTSDILTATVSGVTDADGDAVSFTYVWKVNGVMVRTTTGTTALTDTLDLSQAGNGDRGDLITVEVTPDDGTDNGATATASATVANSAPTATVVFDSTAPLTNDTLTATVTAGDADGDPVTFTYVWRVDGVIVRTTADTTSLTDALDLSAAGNGDRGQVVTVEVTPSDGTLGGVQATTNVTVANSAPLVGSVVFSPNNPDTDALLTATANGVSDADGDPVTLTYVWKVNGTVVLTTPATMSPTDVLDLALAGFGDTGDEIVVEVTPFDGALEGATASATTTVS
jgi:hypothetical protein